jgi:chromosome segregation ATPase
MESFKAAAAAAAARAAAELARVREESTTANARHESERQALQQQISMQSSSHSDQLEVALKEGSRLRQALADLNLKHAAAERAQQQQHERLEAATVQVGDLTRRLEQSLADGGAQRTAAGAREQDLRQKLQEQQRQLDEMSAKLAAQTALATDLDSRLRELQLQATSDRDAQRVSAAEKQAQLEASLTAERTRHERALAEAGDRMRTATTAAAAREAELQQTVDARDADIARLQRECAEARTTAQTHAAAERAARGEVDALAAQLAAQQASNNSTAASLSDQQKAMAALHERIAAITAELKASRAHADACQQRATALETQLAAEQAKITQLEQQQQVTQQAMLSVQENLVAFEQQARAAAEAQTALYTEREAVFVANDAELRATVQRLAGEIEEWQKSYHAREQQLQAFFGEQITTLTAEKAQALAAVEQLQQYVAAYEADRQALGLRMAEMQQVIDESNARGAGLQSEGSELKGQLTKAREELLAVQKELLAAKSESEERQRAWAGTQQQMALTTRQQGERIQAQTEQIAKLESQVTKLEQALAAAASHRAALQAESDQRAATIEQMQETEKQLRAQLVAVGSSAEELLREQLQQTHAQLTARDAVHAKALVDLQSLMDRHAAEHEVELAKTDEQLDALEAQVALLQQQLESKTQEASQREADNNQLSLSVALLQQQALEGNHRYQGLQQELELSRSEREVLNKNLAIAQQQSEALRTAQRDERTQTQNELILRDARHREELALVKSELERVNTALRAEQAAHLASKSERDQRLAERERILAAVQADLANARRVAEEAAKAQAASVTKLEATHTAREQELRTAASAQAEQHSKLQAEHASALAAVESARQSLVAKERDLAELQRASAVKEEEIRTTHLVETTALQEALANERNRVVEQNDKSKALLAAAAAREAELQQTVAARDVDLVALQHECAEARANVQSRTAAERNARGEIDALSVEIVALKASLETSTTSDRQRQARIVALQQELDDERQASSAKISSLTSEMDLLKTERAQLLASLESNRKQLEDSQRRETDAQQQFNEQSERLIVMEVEADTLRADLESEITRTAQLERQTESDQRMLTQLRHEIETLQREIAALEQAHEDQATTAAIDLAAAREAENDLRAQLSAKESELGHLTSALQLAQQDLAGARARITALESTVTEHERTAAGSTNEIEASRAKVSTLNASIASLSAELATTKDEHARAMAAAQHAHTQESIRGDGLQREVDSLRVNLGERDEQLRAAREREARTRADTDSRVLDLQTQLEAKGAELSVMEEEFERAVKESDQWQQEHAALLEQSQRERAVNEQQIVSLAEDKSELQRSLTRSHAECASERASREQETLARQNAEKQIDDLTRQLREVSSTLEREQRHSADKDERIAELQQQCDQYAEDLATADSVQREMMEDRQNVKNQIEEMRRNHDLETRRARSERASLQADLEDAHDRQAAATKELESARQSLARLHEQQQRQREALQRSAETINELEEERDGLQNEVSDLMTIQKELREENEALKTSRTDGGRGGSAAHLSLIGDASGRLRDLERDEELEGLQKEAASAREANARVAVLEKEIESRNSRLRRIEEQMQELEQENQGLRDEISDMLTQQAQQRTRGSESVGRSSAPSLFPNVNIELVQAQATIEEQVEQLARAQQEAEAREAEIASLQSSLETARNENCTFLALVAEQSNEASELKRKHTEALLDMQRRHDALKVTLESRNSELFEATNSVAALKAELERTKHTLKQEHQREVRELRAALAEARDQAAMDLDSARADAQQESDSLNSEINELLTIISELNTTIKGLKEERELPEPSLLSADTLRSIQSSLQQ